MLLCANLIVWVACILNYGLIGSRYSALSPRAAGVLEDKPHCFNLISSTMKKYSEALSYTYSRSKDGVPNYTSHAIHTCTMQEN